MKHERCDHDWMDVLDRCSLVGLLGIEIEYCRVCGALKLVILGTRSYVYPTNTHPILKTERISGRKARRNTRRTK